jgi:hypothetical protein
MFRHWVRIGVLNYSMYSRCAKRLCQQREAVDEVVEHGVVWWPREVGDRAMQADVAVQRDP